MASRLLPSVSRSIFRSTPRQTAFRTFASTSRRAENVVTAPVRRPVGAFRGGLLGFLLGCTLAGSGLYYYVIDEYKVSNELLIEDIYALQAAVGRIENYVKGLEEKVAQVQKGK